MHRAEGPLTSGTYVAITRLNNEDQLAKVRSNGTGHDLLATNNRNDENIEWHLESLGNDHVRAYSKKSGTAFLPSSYAEGVLLDQESGPVVLILKETETKGEYHMSLAENPSWYIGHANHGPGYKMSKEPTRWTFWNVDV